MRRAATKRVPGQGRQKPPPPQIVPTFPYTFNEARRLLRVRRGRLVSMLESGEVKGRRDGQRWLILGSELLRWLTEGG